MKKRFFAPFLLPVLIFVLAYMGWLPQPLVSFTGITFVAGTSIVNASTSGNINTTGANFIVATLSNFAGNSSQAFSDSKGNTWSSVANCNGGNAYAGIRYSLNPSVGSSHNFTTNNGGGYAGVAYIRSYSGVATASALDGSSCTCTGSSSGASGSITPANSNALLISGSSANANYSSGPDSGFTNRGANNANLLADMGGGIGDLIETTATAKNPSWTWSAGTVCTNVAAFDPVVAVLSAPGHNHSVWFGF